MLQLCNAKSSGAFLWYAECHSFITKFAAKQPQAFSGLFVESEPNAHVNLNFPSAEGEGKRMALCSKHRTRVYLFLALPQPPCATLGQVIHLFMPQSPHL